MDKEIIRKQIGMLHLIKMMSIHNLENNNNLLFSFKSISAVDVLLMPLYYIWQSKSFGKLTEVSFEYYLSDVYEEFKMNTVENIRKIICLLSKGNLTINHICHTSFIQGLQQTYRSIYAELSNHE